MIGHYVGDVTGSITAERTYVTIPESDRQTVVLTCGDRSVEVSWDGLRKFWHVGCTDERVTAIGELHDELRDAIVEVLGNRCDWNQQGVAHAHEVIEKAATLGAGTCEVEGSTLHEYEGGYAGSEWEHELSCGHTVWWGSGDAPEWCPWCGKRVVG